MQLVSDRVNDKEECDMKPHLMVTFCCECAGHAGSWLMAIPVSGVQGATSGCKKLIPAEPHVKRNLK